MLREVPDGFIVVKRGGRPPKHARDIAVFLAVDWRVQHLREKRYQAHDWVTDTWDGLSDAAAVRKALRKARKVLSKQAYVVMQPAGADGAMFVTAVLGGVVTEGAKVWLWMLGELEAREGLAKNVHRALLWTQTYHAWRGFDAGPDRGEREAAGG